MLRDFEDLTVAVTKIQVFWDVTLCWLVCSLVRSWTLNVEIKYISYKQTIIYSSTPRCNTDFNLQLWLHCAYEILFLLHTCYLLLLLLLLLLFVFLAVCTNDLRDVIWRSHNGTAGDISVIWRRVYWHRGTSLLTNLTARIVWTVRHLIIKRVRVPIVAEEDQ